MHVPAKKKERCPLRQLVYISDLKMKGLLDQIPTPVRREIAAELRLDLKLVSLDRKTSLTNAPSPMDRHFSQLALVEEHLKRHNQIGDLKSRSGYFTAEAMMDWMPLDDEETVLFCGYIDNLLLVLGGSVDHLLGRHPSVIQLGSQPYTIRAAVHGSGIPRPENLSRDLLAAAQIVYVTPQPVRLVAGVIARGQLPRNRTATEYLLGTPLYVELDRSRVSELGFIRAKRHEGDWLGELPAR